MCIRDRTTGIMAAISDVSFSVKRGELFVLIGLSGSGKSTIVRCLNMLHKPTKGEILIDGEDITKYNEKQLQELRLSLIHISFFVWLLSVFAVKKWLENKEATVRLQTGKKYCVDVYKRQPVSFCFYCAVYCRIKKI